MSASNPVEYLFPEESVQGKNAADICDHLGCLVAKAFAYGGEIGPNPGYIFRGELDFKTPLQTSLERISAGRSIKDDEKPLIETFVQGEGGRIAALIDGLNPVRQSQPKDDVFWWLSLMRHHGQPTRFLDFTRNIRMALFFAVSQHDGLKDENEKERGKLRSQISSEDLLIYCLPCWHCDDGHSNKTPFEKGEPHDGINMNRALGCTIDLQWRVAHKRGFFGPDNTYELKQDAAGQPVQLWGWDVSHYRIPRIEIQKGMLVYAFVDYHSPARKAPAANTAQLGESWLVRNLRLSPLHQKGDSFNLGEHAPDLGAKRIRIPGSLAGKLQDHLRHCYQLTPAIAYLDFERVKLN